MDLGMVGFDGLASSDTHFPSDPDTKHKLYGSGFLKQERPISEDDWKGLKMAKTDDDDFTVVSKPMLGEQRGPLLRSNTTLSDGQQMLSFSLTDSKTGASFPLYHQTPTSYCTNTGYGSGGLSAASIHGVLTGARGPFTPSQWMELEHQALIYKYILANIPVPSNLLFPIKKAFESAGFSGFSVGPLRTAALGWSGFHLGFSNNTDPEPGRCRRTDGKKWRCSRDAVPDQKYCERHINRGRHRSRKPVEGQSGHSVSGPTSTSAKLMPMASSSPSSVVPGGGGSNSLSLSHVTQVKNFPPGDMNRTFLNKENEEERTQAATDLSMLSSTISIEKNQFSTGRQQNPSNESSRSEFGLVFSDSLLNPLQKNSSQKLNDRERTFGQSVRQFMDEWPQNQTNRAWPDVDLQADNTQLSISIPMSTSDFMSSTSSPTEEKFAPSPLRLSKEVHIGEPNHRQANWWETSVGGPLGEVLHTNTSLNEFKNSSVLNLMTQGWNGSPQLASSPTGPLQRMAFGSQSNSSAGSSPRAGSAPLAPLL